MAPSQNATGGEGQAHSTKCICTKTDSAMQGLGRSVERRRGTEEGHNND